MLKIEREAANIDVTEIGVARACCSTGAPKDCTNVREGTDGVDAKDGKFLVRGVVKLEETLANESAMRRTVVRLTASLQAR